MEEIKKAMQDGVTERPNVGIVGVTMTPTERSILMLILVLGARQNLRNDDNITITADDVQGYCPLSAVDDCVVGLVEQYGYVGSECYPVITYYYPNYAGNEICIQSPYLHALYHHIAAQRDTDAPYADLADKLIDGLDESMEEVM